MTGEGNGCAKLSESDVLAIRKERKEIGTPFQKIADRYSVTKTLVRLIYWRKCWKHI